MAIVHRKTFFAKVGQAGPLVEHFQEAGERMKGFGIVWELSLIHI